MDLLGLVLGGSVGEKWSALLDGRPNRVEQPFRGGKKARNAAQRKPDGVSKQALVTAN
jgi:hypothetical protein